MITEIVVLFILIALSGFFSGSETAFMSLGKFKYKEYLRKKKPHYKLVEILKSNPHKLLSTILIGNNLVNIAAASLATLVGAELFINQGWNLSQASAAGIVTGVLTLVVLIFGEIMPKTYANKNYEKIIKRTVHVIYIMGIIFTPIIFILDFITKTLSPKGSSSNEERITEEEIKTIVNVGSEEGGIDTYEKHLIHKIFQFDDKIVKEIMTPRVKVFLLDANIIIKEKIKEMINEGFSRIPLYENDQDNIVGVFHIRDVLDSLQKNRLNRKLKTLAAKPYFVPESKPIDDLFRDMQKMKIQIAIVVDEFGGLAGIVTIEDLLEEIVGELYDEDDEKVNHIRKLTAREFLISGEATVREVNEITKAKIDGLESETLGSYILTKLEKIPIKGEDIILKKGGKLIVNKVTDKMVVNVRLRL